MLTGYGKYIMVHCYISFYELQKYDVKLSKFPNFSSLSSLEEMFIQLEEMFAVHRWIHS